MQESLPLQEAEGVNMALARDAHRWNSQVPEERAAQVQAQYTRHMAEVRDALEPYAQTDAQKVALEEELARYRAGYLKHLHGWLNAKGRTASTLVTGSANFPAERNRKRMDTERRRLDEWHEWQEKAQKAMRRHLQEIRTPEQVDDQAFGVLARKLLRNIGSLAGIDAGEMEWANRSAWVTSCAEHIKRHAEKGEVEIVDKALALVREAQETDKLKKPVFTARHGAWRYGDLARERAAQIERDALAKRERAGEDAEGEEAVVAYNEERDGIELTFHDKPGEAVRARMKAAGFRWSKRQGLWYARHSDVRMALAHELAGTTEDA